MSLLRLRLSKSLFLAGALLLARASTASAADWLITPFLGTAFGGESPFLNLEQTKGNAKTTIGGSVAVLTPQIFGIEADFGYAPRFFETNSRAGLITGSNLTTLTGNVIIAAPLSITHESLRPYLVGGVGLMHAAISDFIQLLPVDKNLFSVDVGGGAIGLINNRAGLRFELRHFRSVYAQDLQLQTGRAHLSFWRASVGVTLRY